MIHSGFKKFFDSQKVGKERSSVGKFSALGQATRPSNGVPKIDSPGFPVDFALWNFASRKIHIFKRVYWSRKTVKKEDLTCPEMVS